MKYSSIILSAGILILGACSTGKRQNNPSLLKPLTAKITIKPIIRSADDLKLKFTVYNESAKSQQFCKWHTPFEPPMSKYLDIKDEEGTEVAYHGIMAKRIMPPPADSYVTVKPGDSLNVEVNLSKIYPLNKPGKYTIRYNASEISGLLVQDSIRFSYQK